MTEAEVMQARAAELDVEELLRSVADAAFLAELPTEYREQVVRATADGTRYLALAAAGDSQALGELRIVRARIALWTWAGAEHARLAFVNSLKRFLYEATEALGEAAIILVETGLRMLVEAGIHALVEELD